MNINKLTHPPWEYYCLGGWQKLHLHTPSASSVENLLDLRDTNRETELTKKKKKHDKKQFFSRQFGFYLPTRSRNKLKV